MFLYIARGSAGEMRSMLCLFDRLPWAGKLVRDIKSAKLKVVLNK
jgi:hypothetical protein